MIENLQFSLKAFKVVFNVAIERATESEDVRERVENLTDCITYSVFTYTNRGLFECDKLIFTAQMAFQVCSVLHNHNNPWLWSLYDMTSVSIVYF